MSRRGWPRVLSARGSVLMCNFSVIFFF